MGLAVVIFVHWLLLFRTPLAGQNPNISFSKGGIAESVAEGVDGGVDVTEAVGKHPDKGWNHVLMLWSKDGLHDSEDIVRGPRDEKDEQDEGQSLRGLPLLLLLLRCLLDLVLPWQRIMSCSLIWRLLNTFNILLWNNPRGGANISWRAFPWCRGLALILPLVALPLRQAWR